MPNHRIAVFASGSGSNAEEFFKYFSEHQDIRVELLVSNNPKAFALERAKGFGVKTQVLSKSAFEDGDELMSVLKENSISDIVLAGFMLLIPKTVVDAYEGHMFNIHPALLPRFGGKGMYGDHVHQAVLDSSETQSGITIHYVNERYDEGGIISQVTCPVMEDDDVESLAKRIHKLEHRHYPRVVESVILSK